MACQASKSVTALLKKTVFHEKASCSINNTAEQLRFLMLMQNITCRDNKTQCTSTNTAYSLPRTEVEEWLELNKNGHKIISPSIQNTAANLYQNKWKIKESRCHNTPFNVQKLMGLRYFGGILSEQCRKEFMQSQMF